VATDPVFWDERTRRHGHTGWADQRVYRYDQPLRMRAMLSLVRELYPDLRGVRVLDAGCGTGDLSLRLAAAGADVVGVDVSPEVIETARRRAVGQPNVRFVAEPITELGEASGAYDLIVSVTVLQHMTTEAALQAALGSLAAAMAPASRLVALEMTRASLASAGHVAGRSAAAWRQAFATAGLGGDGERGYPQWGVSLLGRLSRVSTVSPARETGATRLARPRRATVALVLAACAPLDHLLRISTPARWADYRIMTLERLGS